MGLYLCTRYLVHFYSDRRSFHLVCADRNSNPPPASAAAAPVELAFLSLEASFHMYIIGPHFICILTTIPFSFDLHLCMPSLNGIS